MNTASCVGKSRFYWNRPVCKFEFVHCGPEGKKTRALSLSRFNHGGFTKFEDTFFQIISLCWKIAIFPQLFIPLNSYQSVNSSLSSRKKQRCCCFRLDKIYSESEVLQRDYFTIVKTQPNLNTRMGLTIKWLCTPHPPNPTPPTPQKLNVSNISAVTDPILMKF